MQFRKVADHGKPMIPTPTGGFHADGSKASPEESANPGVQTYSKRVKEVILESARDVEVIPVSAFNPGILDLLAEDGVLVAPSRNPQVGDEIEFKTVPPAKYRIVKSRGRYCCHCGDKLEDDDFSQLPGAAARAHVNTEHPGEESPDPDYPYGYRCDNFVVAEKV